eukprot:g13926.t1
MTECCKWLQEQRVDLGATNNQGHNALHKAAYGGHAELCKWLQDEATLDPEQPDARGQSCFALARKAGFQARMEKPYLPDEMGAVFRKLNSNGQQVAAAGTLMSKNPIPLKLQKQTMDSLLQTDPTMPGDHIGIGDELWRSVMEIITNIHTANKSANDLKDHIQKVNKMIVDFNEGKLIPNEGMDGTGK